MSILKWLFIALCRFGTCIAIGLGFSVLQLSYFGWFLLTVVCVAVTAADYGKALGWREITKETMARLQKEVADLKRFRR